MELLNEIFSQFNAILWGPPLILLLLGTHLWLSLIHISALPEAIAAHPNHALHPGCF